MQKCTLIQSLVKFCDMPRHVILLGNITLICHCATVVGAREFPFDVCDVGSSLGHACSVVEWWSQRALLWVLKGEKSRHVNRFKCFILKGML